SWNILHYYRLPKNSTVKYISDSAIGAFPHVFQTKFFYPCFIGCDGSAFNSHTVFLNRIRCIYGYLVISSIAMLNAKVKIFYIYIHIRKYELVFNKFPDYACHFIAINFYYRIGYFNFCHLVGLYIFSEVCFAILLKSLSLWCIEKSFAMHNHAIKQSLEVLTVTPFARSKRYNAAASKAASYISKFKN